jgi:hypothetical protein
MFYITVLVRILYHCGQLPKKNKMDERFIWLTVSEGSDHHDWEGTVDLLTSWSDRRQRE